MTVPQRAEDTDSDSWNDAEVQDDLTAAADELDRLRNGLQTIRNEATRHREAWATAHQPTPLAKEWYNGYQTALASMSLIAFQHLDPAGWAENQAEWQLGATANDREWFEHTGNCGHCGNPAGYCQCDGNCGCGPHEPATTPLPCGHCKGTGISIHPKATPR